MVPFPPLPPVFSIPPTTLEHDVVVAAVAAAIPAVLTPIINNVGKAANVLAFQSDKRGRERKISEIIQNSQKNYGDDINIAVWNSSLPVDDNFLEVVESGTVMADNGGGGFRVVVFCGTGRLINNGGNGCLGPDNWSCRGKHLLEGNTITFLPSGNSSSIQGMAGQLRRNP